MSTIAPVTGEAELSAKLSAAEAALDETDLSISTSAADEPAPAVESPAVEVPAVPEPPAPPVQATPAVTTAQPDQGTPTTSAPNPEIEALKAQIAEFKQKLEAKPAEPPAATEPPPTSPELAELDTIIQGISQSFVQVEQTIADAGTKRQQWNTHRNELLNQLLDSDSDPNIDASAIRRQIKQADSALSQFDRFIDSKNMERVNLVQNWRVQTALKTNTERLLKLTQEHERSTQENAQKAIETQGENWRKDKWSPAKSQAASKLPENLRPRFDAYVEKLGKAHLYARNEKGQFTNDLSDPTQFVNEALEDFLTIQREISHSYASAKVADAAVSSPPNGKATAPVSTEKKGIQNEADLERYLNDGWQSASF